MLPIRLEIQNFLAYRNPDPILFEGIHLACLSGPNGAGKSSILDAITWVLWGKSRAKSDDDLVHIGQDEVSVTLDFIQGNDKYRVIRKRRLGKIRADGRRAAGQSTLDLLGYVPEENTYRVISESNMRATQERIIQLVGLDYETFINSAYLQQGRADTFTMQSPSHRKEILSEILKLDMWGILEERAKAKLRDIDSELKTNESLIATIDEEIATEAALRTEYDRVQSEYHRAKAEAEAAEQHFQEMAGAQQEEQQTTVAINRIKSDIRRYENELAAVNSLVQNQEAQLATYQEIIAQREHIEAGYAELMQAQAENEALGDLLRKRQQIDEQIHQLQREIELIRQEILHELTSTETLIHEAARQSTDAEVLEQDIEDLRGQILSLEQENARRDTLKDEITALREEYAALQNENEALKAKMDDLRRLIDTLEINTAEPVCPACGQPLDDTHRQQIIERYQNEGKGMGDQYRANKRRLGEIEAEIKEREGAIKSLEKNIKALNPLRSKLGSLEQRRQDIQAAERRLQELEQYVAFLQERLEKKDYAHELHLQLEEALRARENLNYNDTDHELIRERLDRFRDFQARSVQLQTALNSVETLLQTIEDARARQARFQDYLADCHKQLTELEAEMVEIQGRVAEMNRREKVWHERRTLERNFYESMIALQQQLRSIDQQRERRKALIARSEMLREEKSTYEELRAAFSRNGVPAMIIESVIPELEESTNQLLRRMTDGRLVVRFDTQREKKTGGVLETFDIVIADELGTRDYQLYSGGEAFRINFAIRIALSQLLARRAGTQLRTLFIDEGFGTQDETGRERLIEAITAIQDDFDLILVITHIDELRDAFPVRLEVEKLSSGSRVRII
ncbi:MAG: hypothetical protein CUN55_03825 [Phototrophicales bacterium]|nr:MAG: hypothetical protein CUN55_03825 [Phototrophicales bacterium]